MQYARSFWWTSGSGKMWNCISSPSPSTRPRWANSSAVRGLSPPNWSARRFEERSSLKTWIFKILTNIATRRGLRERRTVPFSALAEAEAGEEDAAVDADRFLPADHDRWPHHWALGPTHWATPEQGLLSGETREQILSAIEALPPAQRTVITLRDVQGWPSVEVCETLGLSEGNQRVLLHRARSKVRTALERQFGAVELTVA